ncbi:MAG: inorganic diphosphatase [Bacilli bacterium]|nr:inorganic diphosphatase [Bacilli bacterium]
MNIWHSIDSRRITKDKFFACIEISLGSKTKYELDKETGLLKLDRILYTSTHYPANYGFIPKTYAEDNDPLDVLVLCNESIIPLTIVECKPIGVMHMVDNGQADEKIIAVCLNDPFYKDYNSIKDLPAHVSEEIKHFFTVYKSLEGKETVVNNELEGAEEAKQVIEESIKRYKDKFEW